MLESELQKIRVERRKAQERWKVDAARESREATTKARNEAVKRRLQPLLDTQRDRGAISYEPDDTSLHVEVTVELAGNLRRNRLGALSFGCSTAEVFKEASGHDNVVIRAEANDTPILEAGFIDGQYYAHLK